MADTHALPMGGGRRAPRAIKLEKPAPLRRSISDEPKTISLPAAAEEKENTFQGLRAPRRSNLKKPLPRSKSISDEMSTTSFNLEEGKTLTPNTAKRTADSIISDVLADLKEAPNMVMKPRLKSQVSVDSGVGDTSGLSSHDRGRHNSIHEVLPDEGFNDYPDDILTIEEELSALDFDAPDQPSNIGEASLKQYIPRSLSFPGNWRCFVEREPISPVSFRSTEDEVIESVFSPSGRRHMFKQYQQCVRENTGTSPATCMQYTADELLEMGMSPLSQTIPESWTYLVHVFPGICLSKVDKYFDAVQYQQERGYVVECFNVRGPSGGAGHSYPDNSQFSKPPSFKYPVNKVATATANYNLPRHGFGNPNKRTENQSDETRERTDSMSSQGSAYSTGEFPQVYTAPSYPQGYKRQADHQEPECTKPNPPDVPDRSRNVHHKSSERRDRSRSSTGRERENPIKVVSKGIDLDSKCDVSVRNHFGAIKLFAAAKHALRLNSMKTLSIALPALIGESTMTETSSKPARYPNQGQNYPPKQGQNFPPKATEWSKYYEEDFYINTDLPEKCPW